MSKIIIFCADGTWNGPNEDEDSEGHPDHLTNVLKLFRRFGGTDTLGTDRLANEKERVLIEGNVKVQVAKYIHGVGDSNNPLVRLLGGAVGTGTISRIVRGYTFISRHYQPGDAIVLNGFSRGAYTARALGGMIAVMGLLRPELCPEGDKEAGYRLGIQTWRRYREARIKNEGVLARLGELMACLDGVFAHDPSPDSWIAVNAIAAEAVWDTVGALGIPSYVKHGGRRDVYDFTDNKLSAKVLKGFHAVSIDDQRIDFTPTLWDADQRVTQVLFAGCHSDVGGGYPNEESQLSNISLLWMIDQLESQIGVRFQSDPLEKPEMDALADAHDPLRNLVFAMCPQGPRQLPGTARMCLSQSVLDRFGKPVKSDPSATAKAPYQPFLPNYLTGGKPCPDVTVIPYPHKRS